MDIQKELDTAYSILCAISVKGNDVERMAAAKQAIKKAYQLASEVKGDG